jgi:PIN domain nuclease of toxin-antitoxin system
LRRRLAKQGIHPLSVTQEHGLALYDLPLHHADPFDRMIISQAIVERMVVLTADRAFQKYPVELIWCGK